MSGSSIVLKNKEKRGWGSCSFRMRWSRGSFWGDVHWAESCHDFYYTRFGGLIIVFGAMEFNEASLQGFWLINLKDLLRSRDFGVSDLLREWSSLLWFSVLFLLLSVLLRQEQKRWSSCWSLGWASKQTERCLSLQVGFELGCWT